MSYRFATVGEHKQLMLTHNSHDWHQQSNIVQFIALPVWHQLTKADHTCPRTAFKFTNSLNTNSWLKNCHAIDAVWIAAHRVNHIAVRFLYQTNIGPAK